MLCGIYKITNNITNKCYIGKSVDIERRFKEHKNSKDNFAIHTSIKKYGIKNFSFEIIELCDKNELNDKEKYWIKYYNSYLKGYNETPGGEGVSEANRIKINQYSLEGVYLKTFNSITEAIQSLNKDYSGSQISSVCNGKRKSAFNFQWRYEKDYKDKLNIEPVKAVDKTRKKIYQYKDNNLINIFENISIASKETGIGRTSISNCLNGYSKSAGGYYWKKES